MSDQHHEPHLSPCATPRPLDGKPCGACHVCRGGQLVDAPATAMPTVSELPYNPIIDRTPHVLTRANAENMLRNLRSIRYEPNDPVALAGNLHDAVVTILEMHSQIDRLLLGVRR